MKVFVQAFLELSRKRLNTNQNIYSTLVSVGCEVPVRRLLL